jgi:hypothetical protein
VRLVLTFVCYSVSRELVHLTEARHVLFAPCTISFVPHFRHLAPRRRLVSRIIPAPLPSSPSITRAPCLVSSIAHRLSQQSVFRPSPITLRRLAHFSLTSYKTPFSDVLSEELFSAFSG